MERPEAMHGLHLVPVGRPLCECSCWPVGGECSSSLWGWNEEVGDRERLAVVYGEGRHAEAGKGGAAVLKGRTLLPAPPSWGCDNRSLVIPHPVGYVELLSVARPFLMPTVRAEG